MSPKKPITSAKALANPAGGNGPESTPAVPDHDLIRCVGAGAYGEVWLARNVLGAYRAIKVVYRKSFRDERTYEREFRGIQQFEPVSRTNDGLLDVLQAGRNDDAGYYYYVMELADQAEPGANADSPLPMDRPSREPSPPAADLRRADGRRAEAALGRVPQAEAASAAQAGERPAFDVDTYTPKTLATLIQQHGRLPPGECVSLGLNLTLALGHLHRQGLIHRDIKPANIILVRGIPKLADLGLVTTFDNTCSFVGTEGFIAPEGPTSPCADLFSLGKVLYEISTGKDRKDFPEPATGFGEESVPSSDGEKEIGRSDTLTELNAVILKACATNVTDRYQSAEEFHADLALLNSGRSVKWKRVVEKRLAFARKAGVVVGVMAVLATSGYLYQRHQTREAIRLKQISEDLATRMQMRNAENLLQRGEPALGLANLAQVLRRQPDNRVAAERIMAALTQRKFPRLATRPLVHASKLMMSPTKQPAHFSPDGQRIVTASADNTVRIWDAQTGAEVITPVQHSSSINSVEFSPDGLKVMSASNDGTVQVLDAYSGQLLFPALTNDGPVVAAMFDQTGRFIGSASGSMVRVYHGETGRLLYPPLAHEQTVDSLAFSPDGEWLATASGDGVRVWGTAQGELVQRFQEKSRCAMVRFSGDGKRLAAAVRKIGDSRSQIHVWEVRSGQLLAKPPMYFGQIFSLAFSPDSQRIVSQTGGKLALVWEAATGKVLFRLSHPSLVYSACFSPDGRQVLTASVDHTARLWDASTGEATFEPMSHEGRVSHAEFSRDGQSVLTAGWEDKSVKIWDIGARQFKTTTLQHNFELASGEFSESGGELITATGNGLFTANSINSFGSGNQQYVVVWEPAAGRQKWVATLPEGNESVAAQFTKTGPKALVARRNMDFFSKRAWLWDLADGKMVGEPIRHEDYLRCAHFASDGRKLATGSADGTARIWDARHGALLMPPLVHTGTVMSVRFSPDGTMLVTTSDRGTALLWDALSGKRLAPPLRHEDGVWFAQFSPNSDKVVTVSRDYSARVWSTNGTLFATLRHSAAVEYAEFSPDGTKVATAAGDRTACLWNASTEQRLTEPLEHGELVLTARFSPDGLRVLTASMDGTAQVWDVSTGLKLGDPFRHGDVVMSARFNRDGHQAVTASRDSTARIWEVPIATSPVPRWLPELAEAVGGKRLSLDGNRQVVSWNEYADLKARLGKLSGTDPYIRYVRPFTGDNGEKE